MLIKEKKGNGSMYICLIAAFLAIAHMYTGSGIFMMLFSVLIGGALLVDKKDNKIDYIIFFSTWVYVLKFSEESHSIFLYFSIGYCILMFPALLNKKVDSKLFLLLLLFLGTSFISSAFNAVEVNSILGLLVNYFVVALTAMCCFESVDLKKWIRLYVTSILIQCFVSYMALDGFGQVGNYLESLRNETVLTDIGLLNRFSGFEIDPNYFATEILIAICCMIVYMLHEKKRIFPALAMMGLMFFGLLSLSKMYLLCLCILIVVAIVMLLKENVALGGVFIFLVILGAAVIWNLFGTEIMAGFSTRLDGVSSAEDLTTGRTATWVNYIDAIGNSFKVMLMGSGYGSGFINKMAAHNGYLSLLYFWGLFGSFLFIMLIRSMDRVLGKSIGNAKGNFFSIRNLAIIILLITNLSLDCVLMDFFPMAIFLAIVCRHYNISKDEKALT